jgi:single-strand DNA-binding protein
VGNLTRDPNIRQTPTGTNILDFGIAVNDRVKDSSGNWTDYANFFDIVVFGNRAESLSKILTKGMRVAVNGKLRYSSWEKDGQKRSKIEIIANDIDIMQRKGESQGGYQQQNGGQQSYQQNNYQQQQPQGGYQQPQYDNYASDDIPFNYPM